MFFINVDRSSNNPRFEAQTHRTQPQQFALAVLHQSQRSLFFIDLEANRVRTRHQMVQTPISSFITASTADLMSSSLVHFLFSTFSLSNGSGWKLDFRINLFQWEHEVLNNLLQSLSMSSISRESEDCLILKGENHEIFEHNCNLGDHLLCYSVDPLEFKKQCHIQKFRIEVIQREPWELIKDEDIKKTAASFSAIKVGGEKMYEKARRGESIELSPRRISIFQFEIKRSLDNRQNLIFRVTCSKGTYIRSLCANLGKAQNSFQLCTFLGFVESFNQFL